MANSKKLFSELFSRITLDEPTEEIESILYFMMDLRFNLSRTDILTGKTVDWDPATGDELIRRINRHEPVQYILGETNFYSRRFFVNPAVLIPRPETELLIDEILSSGFPKTPAVLDIGTGSGCIAVTLAKEIRGSTITATDISEAALALAQQNATLYNAVLEFHHHDILRADLPERRWDIIVSNPPYIPLREKSQLKENVLNYEPHAALFAPADDPLAFYRAIAEHGQKRMSEKGVVVVEIHEHYGDSVAAIFVRFGFRNVRVKKDLNNKDRIVLASR